jgi:hypothetical protein
MADKGAITNNRENQFGKQNNDCKANTVFFSKDERKTSSFLLILL